METIRNLVPIIGSLLSGTTTAALIVLALLILAAKIVEWEGRKAVARIRYTPPGSHKAIPALKSPTPAKAKRRKRRRPGT